MAHLPGLAHQCSFAGNCPNYRCGLSSRSATCNEGGWVTAEKSGESRAFMSLRLCPCSGSCDVALEHLALSHFKLQSVKTKLFFRHRKWFCWHHPLFGKLNFWGQKERKKEKSWNFSEIKQTTKSCSLPSLCCKVPWGRSCFLFIFKRWVHQSRWGPIWLAETLTHRHGGVGELVKSVPVEYIYKSSMFKHFNKQIKTQICVLASASHLYKTRSLLSLWNPLTTGPWIQRPLWEALTLLGTLICGSWALPVAYFPLSSGCVLTLSPFKSFCCKDSELRSKGTQFDF